MNLQFSVHKMQHTSLLDVVAGIPNSSIGMVQKYRVRCTCTLNPLRAHWRVRQKQDIATSVGLAASRAVIPPCNSSTTVLIHVVFAFPVFTR